MRETQVTRRLLPDLDQDPRGRDVILPANTDLDRPRDRPGELRLEIDVAAPLETVWAYLRDPQLIRRWHGWDHPDLQTEIESLYLDGASEGSREGEAAHALRVEGGDRFELDALDGPWERTQVRLIRPPRSGAGADYDDETTGWTIFLDQLRFALEQHPGADRTAIVTVASWAASPLVVELGLPAAVRPGDRLTLELGDKQFETTVWGATPTVVSLVVDEAGPGLLVLADRGGARRQSVMGILTTFGDAGRETEVRDAWFDWWSGRFGTVS